MDDVTQMEKVCQALQEEFDLIRFEQSAEKVLWKVYC